MKWLLGSVDRFCDKNLTKMGSGCQNVDLNRGCWWYTCY